MIGAMTGPHEIVAFGDAVFVRVGGRLIRHDRELVHARELLEADELSPLAAFADELTLLAKDTWIRFDEQGRIRDRRAAIVPAPVTAVLAWLAIDTAIVELADGTTRLVRLDGSLALKIRPAWSGLVGTAKLVFHDSRLIWAQSRGHLTIIELDRWMRPQAIGGVDRLVRAPTVEALWLSSSGDRAATLAADGSVERFDLVRARPIDRGWLPRVCAADAELERFLDLDGHWIRPSAQPSPGMRGAVAGTWVDDRVIVLDGPKPRFIVPH